LTSQEESSLRNTLHPAIQLSPHKEHKEKSEGTDMVIDERTDKTRTYRSSIKVRFSEVESKNEEEIDYKIINEIQEKMAYWKEYFHE
jgi:hypothetical protein